MKKIISAIIIGTFLATAGVAMAAQAINSGSVACQADPI